MADTAYVISVATEIPEAGITTAQLDELSASLIAAGHDAHSLEVATIAVNEQMLAAKAAVETANAALAEGNAKYAELEAAAVKASKAVEKAGAKGIIDPKLSQESAAASAALEEYGGELASLEHAAAGAAAAQDKLAQTQTGLKTLSGGLAAQARKQAEALREVKRAEAEAAAAARQQASALDAVNKKSVREAEGMVPLVKQFNDLGDAMGSSQGRAILMAGAAIGAATAIAAITVAAIAGTAAIAAWGVSLASAKREAALTDEAAAALHPELAALSGDFASISAELGASNGDMRKWVKSLEDAKVSADDMPAALRAVAIADAALGKGEGIGAFLEDLKDTKRAAGAVAADISSKLGGVATKRMMGLDAQTVRLKKNLGDLFGGLTIDPVLEGMRVLTDLFDKSTASGQAMKFLFEKVFQPLIDQATNAAYAIEAFALGFLIGMTKVYIAVKPAIKAVAELLGFEDTSLEDVLSLVTSAGEAAAYVFVGFVGVLGLLGAALGAVIATGAVFTAGVYSAIAALVSLGASLVSGVISAFQAVRSYLSGINLADIGVNLMLGLANGITAGASSVVASIVGAAKGAITAAKSALGIASPSKVFAEIGGYTAEGFALGVDDGAADAQAAMAAMVAPPDAASPYAALAGGKAAGEGAASASPTGAAPSPAKAGAQINFNAPVYFGGKEATTAEKRSLAEEITLLLEGDALAAGAA